MTHILLIWTVVACSHSHCKHDWRPLGEFHLEEGRIGKKTSQEMCEAAATSLVLKVNEYRCVRSK